MRLKNLVMAMAVPALLAGGLLAADESAPIRMRIDFGGQQAVVEMNAGEPVQLRNRATGELLVVRAVPEPGTPPRASVEVTRSTGKALAEPNERFELAVGEIGKTRNLSSKVELELLSVTAAAAAPQAKPETFQVNLELPGGRTVMAVGDVRPDEMVRVRDHGTGINLGFRPSFTKAGKPSDIEIFSFDAKAKGGESYRFLARVPVGGEFSVPGQSATIKVKGSIVPPAAGMWDESALVGGATEPVFLRARWDGGPWIDGVTYDGRLFRIEVPGVTGTIGIAAASANGKSSERNLSVFQVQKVQGAGETLKQLDTTMAREDQPVRINGLDGRLEIQFLSQRARNQKKGGTCWLGCGDGVTTHGCGVSCAGTDCCVGICCTV